MDKVLKLYTYESESKSTPFPSIDEQIVICDFTYDAKRMGGAPSIHCTLMHEVCLDDEWTEQVYTEFNGEKYFLKQTPTSSYSNKDSRYKHELDLVSERIILDNVYFYDVVSEDANDYKPVTNSSKFEFFGDITEFVKRLNASLLKSNIGYNIVVDKGISSEEKTVSFENKFFSDVLKEFYDTYQIPYYFVGKEIHIGYSYNDIEDTFKYGCDDALISITKTNSNSRIVNRISGFGSSDNIPYYYPNQTEKGNIQARASDGNRYLKTHNISVTNPVLYGKKISHSDNIFFINQSSLLTYKKSQAVLDEEQVSLNMNEWYSVNYTFTKDHVGKDAFYVYVRVFFTVSSEGHIGLNPKLYLDDKLKSLKDEVTCVLYTKSEYENLDDGKPIFYNNEFGAFGVMDAAVGEYVAEFTYRIYYQGNTRRTIYLTSSDAINTEYWFGKNAYYKDLSDVGVSISGSVGHKDSFYQLLVSKYVSQERLMPYIYRLEGGRERFYDAVNDAYINNETGDYYHFNNPLVKGKPKEYIKEFDDIKPTIKDVVVDGYRIDMFTEFAYDDDDNDETEESSDGGSIVYRHPYFYGKLRKLGFNLFDHALEKGEMTISMTSGHCGACNFTIGVDQNTQKNKVQVDANGNLLRDKDGNVRSGREGMQDETPQEIQNDTINNEVWIALKKDIDTFSTILPNKAIKPSSNDTFVILNILLPQSYIIAAEKKLEQELIKYMSQNNDEKFKFSIDFSRIYFEEHKDALNGLNENSRIKIEYNGIEYPLYVSSYSYKMSSNSPLPEIKIEISDEITMPKNALQTAINSAKTDIERKLVSIGTVALSEGFVRKEAFISNVNSLKSAIIRHDIDQTSGDEALTQEAKSRARNNIGAVGVSMTSNNTLIYNGVEYYPKTTAENVKFKDSDIESVIQNILDSESNGVLVKEENSGSGTILGAINSVGNVATIYPQTLARNVKMSAFKDETVADAIDQKQDVLVSGVNIATINRKSLLNGGNINISSDSKGVADDISNGIESSYIYIVGEGDVNIPYINKDDGAAFEEFIVFFRGFTNTTISLPEDVIWKSVEEYPLSVDGWNELRIFKIYDSFSGNTFYLAKCSPYNFN